MTRFVRLLGGALGVIVGMALASAGPPSSFFDPSLGGRLLLAIWIVAWFVVGYSILPYLTIEPAGWLVRRVMELSTGEFVSAVVGLLLGLLMGLLLGLPLSNFPDPYGSLLPIAVSVILGLGMMGLTVAKRLDLADAMRGSPLLPARPAEAPPGEAAAPSVYLDTSALIDGRIADVVASGFLYGTLIAPQFVVQELQAIADQSDAGRRTRGRRGLEILALLQKDPRVSVQLTDEDPVGVATVDAKLVELARLRDAGIVTTDYNLNRVAQLHGVRVLNLNQLANAVKPAFLPGEEMRVKVVQQGKEPGQGVAYLDDGTMIVVEGGGSFLQRDVDVRVTRVLQTVAGRMVFAQLRGS